MCGDQNRRKNRGDRDRESMYRDTIISRPCAQTRSVTCRSCHMATQDGRNKPTPSQASNHLDTQLSTATKEANQAPTPAVNGTKGTEQKEKEQEIRFDEDNDLPAYALTATDLKMDAVYGNHVHWNDGTHLTGGMVDDYAWQDYWRRPKGPTSKRFLGMLTQELSGIIDRKWNSKRFIVFSIVILQRRPLVVRARDIKKRLEWRMDAWRDSKH
jgi:uncharacterized protein Usg